MTSFERKQLPNGSPNPSYIDLNDEDAPLANQKFACMSFISPDNLIKKREQYLFDEFVKQYDFTKSMSKFVDFLHFIAHKHNMSIAVLTADFNDFSNEEADRLRSQPAEDDWKTFLDKNEERLNSAFAKEHSFQTSVRGFKLRGVYGSEEEAEGRCKKLREHDPNHDIFVGPVGRWIPWHPDAYKTGRIEFLEEELNKLHHEKVKNEAKAKEDFDRRVMDAKRQAIKDNIDKARKSGNVLTQTMDDTGKLIGVNDRIDFDEREVATEDHHMEDLRKRMQETAVVDEDTSA